VHFYPIILTAMMARAIRPSAGKKRSE